MNDSNEVWTFEELITARISSGWDKVVDGTVLWDALLPLPATLFGRNMVPSFPFSAGTSLPGKKTLTYFSF